MTGYLLAKEACERSGITPYILNKLIDEGKVRMKETTDITRGGGTVLLRFVCFQDILDVQAGLEPAFIDLQHVGTIYGITPGAVRFHIKKRRIRWRRNGLKLQPCKPDLDQFLQGNHQQGAGQKSARTSKQNVLHA